MTIQLTEKFPLTDTTLSHKEDEFLFTFEEMKWAAEASAECYKRIEQNEVKPLAFRK
ncbi:Uncharacterised protein [Canicola haemoglobinophilus]|uniref:Uncharacterized protein n=1 Tax=Canicola haemoglobinophilus TaxID=733 RepID=A0A377HVQ9_9PAST|nr:hypothetical protein [Canicola haemoglobinophilus]STO60297.1 Uncharacterised protein [Canicola haemoglobinophilus]